MILILEKSLYYWIELQRVKQENEQLNQRLKINRISSYTIVMILKNNLNKSKGIYLYLSH
jgi:hypothetical protein